MDRVSSTGFQTIGGRRTWQNKNLGSGIQGTTFDQVFFAGVQESIIAGIEKIGLTPTDSTLGSADIQHLQVIEALAGANARAITATPGSPLAPTDAGRIMVNATAGNITVTMPAVAAANGASLTYRFVRTDATANTVSIALHAGDTTLLGALAGPLSLGSYGRLTLMGDGTSHWGVVGSQAIGAFVFTSSGSLVIPPGIIGIEVELWGGSGGSGGGGASGASGGGGAGAYGWGVYPALPGQILAATIGAAGTAGVNAGANGGNGGTTSLAALLSATGGLGSPTANTGVFTPGGAGGTASGGTLLNRGGGTGQSGFNAGMALGGSGGASPYGGGITPVTNGINFDGNFPGGGAGGVANGSNGQAGSQGFIRGRFLA